VCGRIYDNCFSYNKEVYARFKEYHLLDGKDNTELSIKFYTKDGNFYASLVSVMDHYTDIHLFPALTVCVG